MPNTLLILHVKGTQGETAELPKHVVRTAISQGKLTHSQLIWSPVDNAWKQVREWPDLLPSEPLILHVKGTQSETKELPKQEVRSAIRQGQITHSQLIWSSKENTWKQVRELPDLLPSQKLAPAPSRVAAVSAPKAVAAVIHESPTGPVARAAATPQVRVAAAVTGTPTVRAAVPIFVRTTGELVVKEDKDSHPFKWICIGLGILILLVLGGNYRLVDQPLVSNLGQTSYSNVPVYAHFGAFLQPHVLVIHIPASPTITPAHLTDFLVALARSTPENPISRDLFERVALTSGWRAQYSFSGYSWKQFGYMGHETEAQREEFLMAQMEDASGQPLMPISTLNEVAQHARRDQAWKTFVAHFTAKP